MLFDNEYTTTASSSCSRKEQIALQSLKKNIKEAIYETPQKEASTTKQQIFVLIAKLWSSDTSSFPNPSNFLDSVFEAGFVKVWMSKQNLKNAFREHCLTKRRNELIIGGITCSTATLFLKWLVEPSAGFKFGKFDINVLGKIPQFTREMDLELLEAIEKQEGLFMDDTFIDWNVKWSENKFIHEEHLKWRFRHFSGNWKELICYFSFQSLVEQRALQEFRKNVYNHNGKDVVPVKSAMDYIMKPCTRFDALSYLSWVQLALKMNCGQNILLLKAMCEKYALSLPLHFVNSLSTSMRSLLMISKAALEDSDESVAVIVPFLLNGTRSTQDISPENDEMFLMKAKSALIEVFPFLKGTRASQNVNFDLFHVRVFEIAKLWELNSEKPKVQKTFQLLEAEYKAKFPIKRRTQLSDEDIAMMFGCDKPQYSSEHFEPQEVFAAKLKTEKKISSFAKKFCWRTISEDEWKRMLSVILKLDLITKIKGNNQIWEVILKAANVVTGKNPEMVQAIFFKEILPLINNYLPDIDAQRYFLSVVNSI